jgi:integrase/recombinase XerD
MENPYSDNKKMPRNQKILSFKPAELHQGKEWFVSYYVLNPATEKLDRKKIMLNRIKSITERRKFAAQLIQELNKKLYGGWNPYLEESAPRGFTPLKQVLNSFYNSKERELRADSLRSYRSLIDIFCKWLDATNRSQIFSAKFDKLDALEFLEYVYNVKRLSNKTWNNYKLFFSNVSNWMIEHKYAAVNHFTEIKKKQQSTKNRVVIDHEIREKIQAHLETEDYNFMIVCLLVFHSLIRPKEIANLKPSNFDLENQTIFISGSFSKNHNNRISTIPNSFLPHLLEWNFNGASPEQYIFGTNFMPGNKPICSRRFAKKWDRLRDQLALEKEMKLYSLRDSGIIQMLNDGISPEEVRKQADHSSLEMTTVYTKHANPKGSDQIKSKNTGF